MKTLIEAGHYYSVNGPSELSVKGWDIGKAIQANAESAGLALFIDDYHDSQDYLDENDSFLEPGVSARQVANMQQEASAVFSESAIASTAPAKIEALLDEELVKFKKGVITNNGIRLGAMSVGSIDTLQPTCVFLDYLLLIKKAEIAAEQVVVLPATYQKQQAQLAVIAETLSVPGLVGYQSVFYDLSTTAYTVKEEINI